MWVERDLGIENESRKEKGLGSNCSSEQLWHSIEEAGDCRGLPFRTRGHLLPVHSPILLVAYEGGQDSLKCLLLFLVLGKLRQYILSSPKN